MTQDVTSTGLSYMKLEKENQFKASVRWAFHGNRRWESPPRKSSRFQSFQPWLVDWWLYCCAWLTDSTAVLGWRTDCTAVLVLGCLTVLPVAAQCLMGGSDKGTDQKVRREKEEGLESCHSFQGTCNDLKTSQNALLLRSPSPPTVTTLKIKAFKKWAFGEQIQSRAAIQ